jgi:hypothetical protein
MFVLAYVCKINPPLHPSEKSISKELIASAIDAM